MLTSANALRGAIPGRRRPLCVRGRRIPGRAGRGRGPVALGAAGTTLDDVGCDEAMAVLHIYVDLAAAGQDPAERYPGVAAHFAACGACAEDFAGLLMAAASD